MNHTRVMARPQKSPEKKRSHRLPHVRCTAAEYAQVQALSAQAGMGMSEFVREAVLSAETLIVSATTVSPELLFELNKLGNNFNQMTRIANTTGEVPGGLEKLHEKLDLILDKVMELSMSGT